MHAYEDRFLVDEGFAGDRVEVADAAAAEGDVEEGIADGFVDSQFERSVGGFDGEAIDAADEGFALQAEFDEVGDGAQEDVVPGAEFLERGEARHGAVFGHDLDDDRGAVQAGEAAEIDAALGLAGAFEDAAGAGAQGEDVAGAAEIFGACGRLLEELDGLGALGGGDAGGDAEARVSIDRDGERGAQGSGVVGGLRMQVQTVAVVGGHRDAQHAACFPQHEVDHFRGDELSGADEIAFIFAIFIVHEDDHLPRLESGDDLRDFCRRHNISWANSFILTGERRGRWFQVFGSGRLGA